MSNGQLERPLVRRFARPRGAVPAERSLRRPSGRWRTVLIGVPLLLHPGCSKDEPYRPNILLISIDTLRADALGEYGNPRNLTPNIDALARSGVVFERCFSTAPNTAPSHMSVMTSLYPTTHAVRNTSSEEEASGYSLPPTTTTLAEALAKHGYETVGFADGGNVSHAFGFDRGFERYRSFQQGVREKIDQSFGWLDRLRDKERPFFLFFHTYEVHAPYLPPRPWIDRFARPYDGWIAEKCFDAEGRSLQDATENFNDIFNDQTRIEPADAAFLRDLYDAGVAFTDHELGRLFDGLHERGVTDDLLVIFISDHGEEFGEHGSFGHRQVFDEVTHVPLILNGPMLSIQRDRVADLVSLIDVMPTILDLVGIDVPDQAVGRSLRAAFEAGRSLQPRPAYAELIGPDPGPILSMVREPERKLTRFVSPFKGQGRSEPGPPADPEWHLYDLREDPGETNDLVRAHNVDLDRLRALHDEWVKQNLRSRGRFGSRAVDASVPSEELQQLGY